MGESIHLTYIERYIFTSGPFNPLCFLFCSVTPIFVN